MCARPLALSVAFRRRGWQWPFREGDTLRVYRAGDRVLIAELPAPFVLQLVEHYLTGAALQAKITDHLGPMADLPPVPDEPLPVPRLLHSQSRRLRGRLE